MDDVVHLAVLLLAALEHVRRGGLERVEAVRVGLGEVDRAARRPRSTRPPACPIPPACVTHTASQIQKPRTFARSPTIEPASGVNENIPLIDRSGSAGRMRPASAGRSRAPRPRRRRSRSGVNGIDAGCGPSPGDGARTAARDRLVAVVADAVVIPALAEVHRDMSWWRRIGCTTSRVRRRAPGADRSTRAGAGRRRNGIGTPAIRADASVPRSRRRPAPARTRRRRGRSRTPCTRPSRMSNPVTRDAALERDALGPRPWRASAAATRTPLRSRPRARGTRRGSSIGSSIGTVRPSRRASGARCPRSRTSGRTRGDASAPRIRASGVVATSIPPTPYQAGSPSRSRPAYSSTESWAIRHIVREPFVWKARPGACESNLRSRTADPGRGPGRRCSPSSARW